MGSGTSKDASASSSGGAMANSRSRGSRISCLGRSARSISDDDLVPVSVRVESGKRKSIKPVDETKKKSCYKSDRAEEGIANICSDAGSSSIHAHVTRNRWSHSCTHFGFIPRNIRSRLCRAASLGSSGSCSIFFGTPLDSNFEEDCHANTGPVITDDMNEGCQRSNLLPLQQFQDRSSTSGLQVVLHDQHIVSSLEVARRGAHTMAESTTQGYSGSTPEEIDNAETRHCYRWVGGQESFEGSMRFSRARSVGRLRDRVLCRTTSSSEGMLGNLQEAREARNFRLGNMRPFRNFSLRGASSGRDVETSSTSNRLHPCASSSRNSSLDCDTPSSTETRNYTVVEHRMAFLERRMRIRSQVRALQRLGNRIENLAGHDRSCILSGQHRNGRCMCQASGRASNQNGDTNARASISRIIMLAEALFEVLDEIHQQSAMLSSRPSVSSLGSVPAPKEVVDCMPVKIYTKPLKYENEEAAQCYICLVEYGEGDLMRMLPCHHGFHQTCIDRWLKEIHRVCPLCRGDVCRPELPVVG